MTGDTAGVNRGCRAELWSPDQNVRLSISQSRRRRFFRCRFFEVKCPKYILFIFVVPPPCTRF